jgi:hypothetical protein
MRLVLVLNQQIFKQGFGKLCTSTPRKAALAHRSVRQVAQLALGRHVAGVLRSSRLKWSKSFFCF